MHVLYVHQNFPAQFGHIASHLAKHRGWKCSFVSKTPAGDADGIRKIAYGITGGATKQTHFCSRTFENAIWHTDGVYQAMKAIPNFKPDLIVGHSGFGSTLFLPEIFPDVPVLNLFEFYYRPHHPESDMGFRQDLGWPTEPQKYLRARCRNAMILLDLQNCAAGYTPTQFQRSCFPDEYAPKLNVIFDGVDRTVYHGHDESLRPPMGQRRHRTIAGVAVPPDAKVVTYVSRGFESMRGFDLFMRGALRIAQRVPEAIFIVVGTDQMAYGGDDNYIAPHKTFKEWTLAQPELAGADLSRFHFVGRVPMDVLSHTLASTDLHIYLTVPFVLSWSMMDAMSCGAVVLASATSPVREMVRNGENGLLFDFFNVNELADKAAAALADINGHRALGRAAEQMIANRYSLDAVLPAMLQLYQRVASNQPA